MAEANRKPLEGLNVVGLALVAAAVAVTAVGFPIFARAAKAPSATWTAMLYAVLTVLVAFALVVVGSWLNGPFYRALETGRRRAWIEDAGAVALVLGLALFGSGTALYWLAPWTWPVQLMMPGLVLIELALAAEHRTVIRICTSPSFPVTLIVVAAGVLGAAALGLISVINVRHYRRADLTSKGLYTLDNRTVRILKGGGAVDLTAADIQEWPSFCARLKSDGAAATPSVGRRLWELLPADAKSAIEAAADKEPDDAAKAQIAGALNEVLRRRDLYRKEDLEGVAIPAEALAIVRSKAKAKEAVEKDFAQALAAAPEADAWRVNRILLEAAYGKQIAKSRGLRSTLKIVSTMVPIPSPRSDVEASKNYIRVRATELIEQYASQSQLVEYIPLNPYADPESRVRIESELKTELLRDSVIFAYEGKTKVVEFNDFLEPPPGPREPPAFKGEQAFTSAIMSLIEGATTKVYFVKGHGELAIDDYRREGTSNLIDLLRGDNCEVKAIELPEIPDDCDVLVIAGPKRPFLPNELDAVRSFLTERRKGLIALLDPAVGEVQSSGLEPLLKDYGIEAQTELTLLDIVPAIPRSVETPEIGATDYGGDRAAMWGAPPHPIIKDMKGIRSTYLLACPVSASMKQGPRGPYGQQGDPFTTEIVKTSGRAFAKMDYDPTSERFQLDPDKDKHGPFSIAVAHGAPADEPPRMPFMMRPPSGKIVVFGDSDFVTNTYLERAAFGNATLFRNALAWVAGREYRIGIPAKPLRQERQFEVTPEQKALLWWAVVFVPPFHILLLGVVVWWLRRS